jgi:gluconate 2-dehydrogenase gamma chain
VQDAVSRRRFLVQSVSAASASWLAAHWPAALAAADHAHQSAQSATPRKFEFFTSEQAAEVDAITACIIPTDELPGAREAGVVYFIDRALKTFASADQKAYTLGLLAIEARVLELFPGIQKFSAATLEQQEQVLHSIEEPADFAQRPFRPRSSTQNFFETIRQHTLLGFLIDPESGDNRDAAGWKAIGREREHIFLPPFGYYDKNYAGWQPPSIDQEKK